MGLCNESCLFVRTADWPAIHPSCVANTWTLPITCKLFKHFVSDPTYVVRLKGNLNIDMYSDIYGPIFSKSSMIIETTKLCILILIWVTLTFIQSHSCMRNQKLCCLFSYKFKYRFGWNSVCCHNLFIEALTNYCTKKLQRRDFMKYMFCHHHVSENLWTDLL